MSGHPKYNIHANDIVEDKWDKGHVCIDGALDPFNIDAKLNGGCVAFGLLYGKGDFAKTLEVSTRSLNQIVASTQVRALKVVEEAGGNVTPTEVEIPVQEPQAPPLEQWDIGPEEWTPSCLIADTIMPWISQWLRFYEVWQQTGSWEGEGTHPDAKSYQRSEV